MSDGITKADIKELVKHRREASAQIWAEVRHWAKVSAITIAMTSSVAIGLPSLSLTDEGFAINVTLMSFTALMILIIAILAASGWQRKEN